MLSETSVRNGYLLMGRKKCCCPGRHTPTPCSSAPVVSPAEDWRTPQRVSADRHCRGARRSALPRGSGTAGRRRAGTPALPPAACRLSRSPARSGLRTANTRLTVSTRQHAQVNHERKPADNVILLRMHRKLILKN